MRTKKAAAAPGRRARKRPPLALQTSLTPPRAPATPPLVPAVVPAPSAGEPRWSALLGPELPLVVSALNAAHLELGLAVVVIARRLPPAVICAHFVVDLLAAGVTDVYGEGFGWSEFERYFAELDERVPLQSIAPGTAAHLVRAGVALGERNGVLQPEALDYWERLLPPARDPDPVAAAILASRPLAVAEILPLRPRRDGFWFGEEDEIRCVVRVEGRREH